MEDDGRHDEKVTKVTERQYEDCWKTTEKLSEKIREDDEKIPGRCREDEVTNGRHKKDRCRWTGKR